VFFEAGGRQAAELGHADLEPMVHTGWELLSEVHYFHSFSMAEDPRLTRAIVLARTCRARLRATGLP
jgi:hypothetical protein